MRRSTEQKHNWWKWAFLLLIGILLIGGGVIWYQVTCPVSSALVSKSTVPATANHKPVFQVTLDKRQAQRLANHYISEYLNSKDIKYHLQFDQHISLIGSADLLGSKIGFTLQTDPYPDESGGVQLKARRLKLGSLGIPLGFVLGYVGGNYHFPSWVTVDSHKQLIKIHLQRYQTSDGFYFKVKQLNLKRNKIVVSVYSSKF
ncbi:YpmS family protein [Bombilactobacillus folatiphilus]|uniref:YpmS family protein n=1 Tax=Bombilactobacillus folatiphilus TaxID=2923362 RepID=A0ABY4PB05_9LACO|nr:YpmS family protein [Bombilactobacillus folatiphilus]UQS82785.1 YpmS family protein [Bombilactobacillus folatiphilus]